MSRGGLRAHLENVILISEVSREVLGVEGVLWGRAGFHHRRTPYTRQTLRTLGFGEQVCPK